MCFGEIAIGLNVSQNWLEGSEFHNLPLVYSLIRRKIKRQQRYIPKLDNLCSYETIYNRIPLLEVLLHFTGKYRPGCALWFIKEKSWTWKTQTHSHAVFFYYYFYFVLFFCVLVYSSATTTFYFWPGALTSPAAQHHFTSLLSPPTGLDSAGGSWVMALCALSSVTVTSPGGRGGRGEAGGEPCRRRWLTCDTRSHFNQPSQL